MRKFWLIIFMLFTSFAYAYDDDDRNDSIDQAVYQAMRKYSLPAVSLAVIDHGRIVYARAYSSDSQSDINEDSLFQSASIGKSVSAYGALLLVDGKKIELDKNVNKYLNSWRIPDNSYTATQKVTLRNILDMTSGLSVSGFAGNSVGDRLPTLQQILNGQPPAENPPVRVIFVPGSRYYYSGGSYEVLEQLVEDMTNSSFSDYMQNQVLNPLDMDHSQFIAVLPKSEQKQAVSGYLADGKMIPGRWKIIPALGAGGMWTTPSDLASFAINVMDSYNGRHDGLLSKQLAHEMLARQANTDFGLGFVVDGCGNNLNFRKEGHNIGFYNWLIAFPATRQGAVIMTNSDNGLPAIKDIMDAISQEYEWPAHYPLVDESEQIPGKACKARN